MQPQMSPQDAIQILDNATSTYRGTRQEHMDIALAVNTMRSFVTEFAPTPTPPAAPAEGEVLPAEQPAAVKSQEDAPVA